MADRHNEKAGNRADVWKHFILCGVVEHLLRGKAAEQLFKYVDTHCSLGHFLLPENGQWRQGIGLFYDCASALVKRPYFVMEQKAYESGRSYLGSWKLVEGLLKIRNIQGDLRLFDTSAGVAEQLKGVTGFSQSDGFDNILSNLPSNLYLVDPSYSDHRERDWRRLRQVTGTFSEHNATALMWYPMFVKERNIYNLPGGLIAEVRWSAAGANQQMRGCGIVALGAAADILSKMESSLLELAAALSGTFCLRDQRK